MNRIKKYKYVVIAPIALALVVFVVRQFTKGEDVNLSGTDTKTVSVISINDLFNEAHVTESVGQIDSKQSVDMKAQVNGTIKSVNAKIGDRVYRGQTIASFNNADSYAALAQAEAGVKIQEARLSELTGGSRTEELTVSELAVKNAENSLDATKASVVESIRSAYVNANDVIYNKIDPMFNNPRTNPKLVFTTNNFSVQNNAQTTRLSFEDTFEAWDKKVSETAKTSDLFGMIEYSQGNLSKVAAFLDNMAVLVNALEENSALSASDIASYKSAVSASRTTISSLISALSSSKTALSASETGYEQALQQLSIKETGGTSDQVKAQQALLDQANANLLAAQAQYAKTVITSPINGEISSLPVKVGQYVNVNQTIVKVINKNNLHIKAFINTDDVPYVKSGDKVLIEGVGEGEVTVVSPGIDPSNGKVEVEISIPEEKEKTVIEGEYVHVTIQSQKDAVVTGNTILLPIKAVKVSSKGAHVYVVVDGMVEEREIEVGGVLGTEVEIISGLDASMSVLSTTRGINVGDKVTIE